MPDLKRRVVRWACDPNKYDEPTTEDLIEYVLMLADEPAGNVPTKRVHRLLAERARALLPPLKGYMAHGGNPPDGAVLVFAYSAQHAKKLAWSIVVHEYMLTDDYTDVRVKLLPGADAAEWSVGAPGIVEPQGCGTCGFWYDKPITKGERCDDCKSRPL